MKLSYVKQHLGKLLKEKAEKAGITCNQLAAIWGQNPRSPLKVLRRAEVETEKLRRLGTILGEDLILLLLSEESKAEIAALKAEVAHTRAEIERLKAQLYP